MIGSPIGLLLALTCERAAPEGTPIGLLLALTRVVEPPSNAGSPLGLLLALTKAD